MSSKGTMRTFSVLCCALSASSVLGLSRVKGSDDFRLLKKNPPNPFLHGDPKHAAKDGAVGTHHHASRAGDAKKPELGPVQYDTEMYELEPGTKEYDEQYIADMTRAENNGDFEGMPPDMWMASHNEIIAAANAEAEHPNAHQKMGSKGGGAYEADYEYYPAAKSSKAYGYGDDYYYDDYCYEDEDEEHEEDEEDDEDSEDYVYFDEHGMSYPGKGEGKGGKSDHGKGYDDGYSSTDSGKGKGKGGSKSSYESDNSKSSKKSKGKGGGKGKGGSKGSKSGCRTRSPDASPPPKSGSKSVQSRPPIDVPTPTRNPAAPPVVTPAPIPAPPSPFTSSPTDADSVARELTPYALAYVLPAGVPSRQATRAEQDELEDLTRQYLEEFFFAEYENTMLTELDDFITELTSHVFMMGEPLICNYMSIARFDPESVVFPSPAQLDTVLEIAFDDSGVAVYESLLANDLSDGNIFKGSQATLIEATTRVASNGGGSNSSRHSGITIAATAVAAAMIAASVIIYKKRSHHGEETMNKDLNDKPGDNTVAGDTYDGTASVSAASLEYLHRQRYDEEFGKAPNLGTIAERDDSSVRPAFGIGRIYDDDSESDDDEENDEVGDHEVTSNTDKGFRSTSLSADAGVSRVSLGDGNQNDTELDLSKAPSFEEVALQGPSYASYDTHSENLDSVSEENSQISTSERSRISQPQERFAGGIQEVQSLLTFDSEEDMLPPRVKASSSTLEERPSKKIDSPTEARRPRTVAEIEALLSAGLDEDDDESIMTHLTNLEDKSRRGDGESTASQRPRTIEEIESLLSGEL